jgi:hypothetical protein
VPTDSEAGITAADSYEMRDRDGKVTDYYQGMHFVIGYDKPGHWSGTRVTCGSVAFWIPDATLEQLRGKTLTLIRRYEGDKQLGKIQNLLVAA